MQSGRYPNGAVGCIDNIALNFSKSSSHWHGKSTSTSGRPKIGVQIAGNHGKPFGDVTDPSGKVVTKHGLTKKFFTQEESVVQSWLLTEVANKSGSLEKEEAAAAAKAAAVAAVEAAPAEEAAEAADGGKKYLASCDTKDDAVEEGMRLPSRGGASQRRPIAGSEKGTEQGAEQDAEKRSESDQLGEQKRSASAQLAASPPHEHAVGKERLWQ